MPRNDLIQYRRGTAEQWAAVNPVLADGEVGFSTDGNEIRVGNGVQQWSNLAPIGGLTSAGINHIITLTQAEYDSLPSPRPDDVLYVITSS